MLSYQHEYHCGNHADVLKHAVLALVLQALQRKPGALRVVDANGGSGLYDLASRETRRHAEYKEGIARVLAAADPPAEMGPYLAAVAAANPDGGLQRYPGSPAIARHGLRAQDQLDVLELHPGAVQALRRNLGRDARVHVHARDYTEGVPALLPPPERRGLILLDPSYEVKDEFRRVKQLLQTCHQRFPTGVYLVWYPLLADAEARRFPAAVAGSGIRRIWQAELQVTANDFDGLRGSGVLVINPPFGLDDRLAVLLPWLWSVLGRGGGWRSESLVPE